MPFEIAPKTEEQQRVEMGRIALEAIAAHILTVPPEEVNMEEWCGTACCAIGHGVKLPEVMATGLYMAPSLSHQSRHSIIPAFDGKAEHHESIAAAFGIDVHLSWRLFGNGNVSTGKQVAREIRRYLARTA